MVKRSDSVYLIDLDGTILNTGKYHTKIAYSFFNKMGLLYGGSDAEAYNSMRSYCDLREPKSEEEAKKIYYAEIDARTKYYVEDIGACLGAKELLKYLKYKNERVVILTATSYYLAKAALERLKLMQYIETIISVDVYTLGYRKEDSETYDWLCNYFGEKKEDMVLIDNNPYICGTAVEVGLKVIGVMNEFYPENLEEDFDGNCDYLCKDLVEVCGVLKKLYEKK